MPHEVADLPFHYYLALREDWVKVNAKDGGESEAENVVHIEGDLDYNAETRTEGPV